MLLDLSDDERVVIKIIGKRKKSLQVEGLVSEVCIFYSFVKNCNSSMFKEKILFVDYESVVFLNGVREIMQFLGIGFKDFLFGF